MATRTRNSAATQVEQTIGRIRDLNERILTSARQAGEASLQGYERLLRAVAEGQAATGERGAEWVQTFTNAQARFTRELADALPAATRSAIEHASGLVDMAGKQARRVPGAESVEGEAKGAVAREQDLPIANYDQLTAGEINKRLERLSKTDLRKVDAYERKHGNRKTVKNKIKSLTS